MCTCTVEVLCFCGSSVLTPLMQLLRCCNRRRLTIGSSSGNRPTSLAHSVNPALNLLRTFGSVACDMAFCWRWRFSKCLTVISKMSAFSSFEWRAGCNK